MNSARILIVEDDAVLAVHLEEILKQMNYEVAGLAAAGDKAIQLALAHRPDAILMDIRLRGKMNGIQAAEQIHKSMDVPVVYLTAYTDEALLQQAKFTDAYAYLAKPVRDHELRASLEMALYKYASEKHIRHLNQVLRAVRDVNQLINRERDPQRLIDSACKILINTRGYNFVWIGKLQRDALKVVGFAGSGGKFTDAVVATATAEQAQKLPGVEAVRTKKPVICLDILQDERYAPWLQEAREANLLSAAAVPMMSGEKSFGVLHVYSDQNDLFADDEVDLLSDLANDLAFGLNSIEDESERRNAELLLHESEERYRTALSNMMEGCQIIDYDWRYLYINDAASRQGKKQPDELLMHTMMEVYPGIERTEMFSVMRRCMEERRFERLENKFEYDDGSFGWFELSIQPVPQGIFILSMDVTERKLAEDAIKLTERRYQALIEKAPDGVVTVGLDGKFKYVSATARRMFGFPLDGEINITPVDATHPDDLPKVLSTLSNLIQNPDQVPVLEYRFKHTDGSWRWIESTFSNLIAEPSVEAIVINFREISERKLAEKLRVELASIVESSDDAIVGKTLDGIVTSWNNGAEKMYGYSAEEIVGRSVSAIIAPDRPNELTEILSKIKQGKRVEHLDTVRMRKDGRQVDVSVSVSPIRDEMGQIIGASSIARDISERKKAEGALRESEALYRQAIETSGAVPYREIYHNDSYPHVEYQFIGEGIRQITGYGPEEFTATVWESLTLEMHPINELAEYSMDEAIQRVRSGKNSVWKCEFKIRTRDGKIRWVFEAAIELRDEQGVSDGSIGIYQDITERKQAEDVLQASEERYRGLFEDSPVSIWEENFSQAKKHLDILKQDGVSDFESYFASHPDVVAECYNMIRVLNVNRAAVQMYKAASKADLTSLDSFLTTTEDLENFSRDLIAIAEGKTSNSWEGHDETLTGEPLEISLNWSIAPGYERDFSKAIVTTIDITERKRAEAKLRESEGRYRSLFENMLNGFAYCQMLFEDDIPQDFIYLDVNHAFETLTGLKNVVGKKVSEVIPGILEADPELIQTYGRVASTGIPESFETYVQAMQMWFSISVYSPQKGYFVAVFDVITERKLSEQRIEKQLRRLKAMHTVDQAIASNFDLRVTLNTLLQQLKLQLDVDAASISLFDKYMLTLEHVTSTGFYSSSLRGSKSKLNDSLAGRAVQERRSIHISNLSGLEESLGKSRYEGEKFASYYAIPLISKGQVKGVVEIFQRSQLNVDSEWLDFLDAMAEQAAIAIDISRLFSDLQKSNIELTLAYDATIEGWSNAMDLRDKDTEGHTIRVTNLTLQLSDRLGIDKDEQVNIRRGALLHDIGKLGVPDGILLKPGKLSEEEMNIMKQHPVLAYEMLVPIEYLRGSLDIPYCHHEKWDGGGYPRGLKGEQIPLYARIFAIVDVWDALTSDRPYRAAWSREKTIEYIREQSGKHFEPHIVDAFLGMIAEA